MDLNPGFKGLKATPIDEEKMPVMVQPRRSSILKGIASIVSEEQKEKVAEQLPPPVVTNKTLEVLLSVVAKEEERVSSPGSEAFQVVIEEELLSPGDTRVLKKPFEDYAHASQGGAGPIDERARSEDLITLNVEENAAIRLDKAKSEPSEQPKPLEQKASPPVVAVNNSC